MLVAADVEDVIHWTCPVCSLQWLGAGRGFPGQRFSTCVRCGSEACEPDDAILASHWPNTQVGAASATEGEVGPE